MLCPGQHFQNPTLMIDIFLKIYLNFVHDGPKTEHSPETASEKLSGTKEICGFNNIFLDFQVFRKINNVGDNFL